MKKLLLLFIISPIFLFSQVQIGSDIDGEAALDQSGASISLSSDSNVVAIGSPLNSGNGNSSGHVRIYRNLSGVWTQVGLDIDGEAAGDYSGGSVSLSSDGSVVAIGAWSNDGNGSSSGHVRIYRNKTGIWTQVGSDIDGESSGDTSGRSISLSADGSVVAIGASLNSDNGYWSGHVRIYINQSGIWTQIGDDIDGKEAGDQFGRSVSLSSDGKVVAIGAFSENIPDSGYVRVYKNQSNVWTQVGSDINGEVVGWFKRISLSLSSDGNIVAIGSTTTTANSSHVHIYRNESEVWTQIGLDIYGEESGDRSGGSVSLSSDGNLIAIGAEENDGNGDKAGNVRIYRNLNGVWTQVGLDIDGEAIGNYSGASVSLSSDGTIVAIGAFFNTNNTLRSGHVRVYDLNTVLSTDDFVLSRFSIYPNPTKEIVTIELKQGLELQNIDIYNNLGQLISTSKNVKVDTSNLTTGLYFLEIETNKGKATKKLIIE